MFAISAAEWVGISDWSENSLTTFNICPILRPFSSFMNAKNVSGIAIDKLLKAPMQV